VLDRRPTQRRAIANAADVGSLGWDNQLAALLPILEAAAAPRGARLNSKGRS